jgi:hypothetical protein
MTNRFEKIAAVLADKYVALSDEGKFAASNAAAKPPITWRDRFNTAMGYVGEDPNNTRFNPLLGFGGGALGFVSAYDQPSARTLIKKDPFAIINEVGKSATDPHVKFLHDLFKKYEHSTGGLDKVRKFLLDSAGPQQIGDPAYRTKLKTVLRELTANIPAMKDRLNTLVTLPEPSRLQNMSRSLDALSRYSALPRKSKTFVENLSRGLASAKTFDEVKDVAKKMRDLATELAVGKGGRPAGYSGYTLDTRARNILGNMEKALQSPKSTVNLTSWDDLGRALGQYANPAVSANSALPKITGFRRFLNASGRGAGGAAIAGLGVPMLLDNVIPSSWRPGYRE